MNKFILSLDQGTTSCRALLIDQDGKISGIAQKELTQIYPNNGWVKSNVNLLYFLIKNSYSYTFYLDFVREKYPGFC